MKITQEVREYAVLENIEMAGKAKEFVATGSEIYHGNVSDVKKDHD